MDRIWNHFIFTLLGIILGIVIAWGILFEDGPITKEIIAYTNFGTSNGYFLTFMTTVVAALAAAGIVMLIESIRRKNKFLAEIRAAKAILCAHLDNLVNLKMQHAQVHFDDLVEIRKRAETDLAINAVSPRPQKIIIEHGRYLMKLNEMPMDFLVSIESIAQHADKNTKPITFLIKSKESLDTVLSLMRYKNFLLDKIRNIPDDYEKSMTLLGLPINPLYIDTSFFDVTEGLLENINFSLFFIYETIYLLDDLAKQILPERLQNRLGKFEFINERAKNAMPNIEEYRNKFGSN